MAQAESENEAVSDSEAVEPGTTFEEWIRCRKMPVGAFVEVPVKLEAWRHMDSDGLEAETAALAAEPRNQNHSHCPLGLVY